VSNQIDTSVLDSLGLTKRNEFKEQKLGQDDFMELMMTQMQNQDPFKPMENGEFLGQMAQFGTVSGIQALQNSFAQLSGALTSNQALQASSLVGRTVLVPGNTGYFTGAESLSGEVALPENGRALLLSITDEGGNLVQQISLGDQTAGNIPFKWDGSTASGTTAPPGRYQVSVSARINGRDEALSTLIAGQVESVTMGGNTRGLEITLAGLGSTGFDQVKQIM